MWRRKRRENTETAENNKQTLFSVFAGKLMKYRRQGNYVTTSRAHIVAVLYAFHSTAFRFLHVSFGIISKYNKQRYALQCNAGRCSVLVQLHIHTALMPYKIPASIASGRHSFFAVCWCASPSAYTRAAIQHIYASDVLFPSRTPLAAHVGSAHGPCVLSFSHLPSLIRRRRSAAQLLSSLSLSLFLLLLAMRSWAGEPSYANATSVWKENRLSFQSSFGRHC